MARIEGKKLIEVKLIKDMAAQDNEGVQQLKYEKMIELFPANRKPSLLSKMCSKTRNAV